MKNSYQILTYLTAAEISVGALDIPVGAKIIEITTAGVPTGNFYEKGATGVQAVGVGNKEVIGGKGTDVAPHNMTANNAPAPYVAAASSSFTSFNPYLVFSGYADLYWVNGNGIALPHWVSIDLGSAKTLYSYAVQVNSIPEPNRAPQAWTFEGSDNNTAWTVLDTRTAQTGWTSGQIREFTLATQAAYRYYRINISANNGDALTQLAELYLYDNTGLITVPAIPAYSSNEAALAGNLTIGQFYRSNGNPDVVCVVH